MPRETKTVTISLPPDMAKEVEHVRKAEHRTSSELWREAMRDYLRARTLPAYVPTRAELRAIERGRAAIRRGDYYTLDEFRTHLLGAPRPQASSKKSGLRATSRTRKTRRRS